jgi:hypothetical protein
MGNNGIPYLLPACSGIDTFAKCIAIDKKCKQPPLAIILHTSVFWVAESNKKRPSHGQPE